MEETSEEYVTRLLGVIEDLCYQFAYPTDNPSGITTGGLSVLEEAFKILGWGDPKVTPWQECAMPECHRTATCGLPYGGEYLRVCGQHFRDLGKET